MASLFKETDDEYFARGNIDIDKSKELVISNSLLKRIVQRGLYDVLVVNQGDVSDDLQARFDIGHAVHTRILEPSEFMDRFYISNYPDHKEKGIRISENDFDFMPKALENIEKKYPEIMDAQNAEVTVTFDLDGVKCKCKMDKIVQNDDGSIDIYDVKTTYLNYFKLKSSHEYGRYGLRREMIELGYDLQAYFYTKAIETLLMEEGGNAEVRFHFLAISTDTSDVQMFTAGEELMRSGEEKFRLVWSEIVDFVRSGKDTVAKELVV